jgi:hypothetical protein
MDDLAFVSYYKPSLYKILDKNVANVDGDQIRPRGAGASDAIAAAFSHGCSVTEAKWQRVKI